MDQKEYLHQLSLFGICPPVPRVPKPRVPNDTPIKTSKSTKEDPILVPTENDEPEPFNDSLLKIFVTQAGVQTELMNCTNQLHPKKRICLWSNSHMFMLLSGATAICLCCYQIQGID
jgi:hypothetical protein